MKEPDKQLVRHQTIHKAHMERRQAIRFGSPKGRLEKLEELKQHPVHP